MMQLIQSFKKEGSKVTFASAAADSDFMVNLADFGVDKENIKLNCSSFDDFLKKLNPDLVVFDRFMTEEQYGWRVSEACPNTLKLLDTEDLHTLRYARQKAFRQNRTFKIDDLLEEEIAKREIASIFRCDLSLVISQTEMEILNEVFHVDLSLLYYLPFLLPSIKDQDISKCKSFEERQHFVSIGNFLHEPNWNAVLYLKEEIWPLIKSKLPKAELHVYGAYPSQKVWELNNAKQGFLIKGRAEDVNEVMSATRVCLAPLRFGAGLKGKLVDAMRNGTPSVTTSIGAESMALGLEWAGFIADDAITFAEKATTLYQDLHIWNSAVRQGVLIINQNFNESAANYFLVHLSKLKSDLVRHRNHNFIGQMLNHHSMASTKFMSKWIEAKNSNGSRNLL